MTFMFQFPEFISIPLKTNVTKKFPNYSIPVLFVPGNGGSYKQVRSFGSIALRMADESLSSYNFDFFTINFNEELSGLSGDLLIGQTEFLYECIEAIKKLYMKVGRRVSLIVIGHSVGGLISRAVFTDTNFDPASVDLLITLATPHQRAGFCTFLNSFYVINNDLQFLKRFVAVLPIDLSSTTFYEKVNNQWSIIRSQPQLSHLTVVSINGGFNDKLVRSELTQLPVPLIQNGDITLGTSLIPDVWVSTDHLCIVWCRQLIIKLMRLLYDLIEKDSNHVTNDLELRKKVIEYHLIKRTREKTYPTSLVPEKSVIPAAADNMHQTFRFHIFQKQKVISSASLMIPLIQKTTVVIQATVSGIEYGINLSPVSKIIPGDYDAERRFYKYDASQLLNKGFDHLFVYVAPTKNKVTVISERYQSGRRNRAIVLPSLFQSLTSWIFSDITVLNIPITEESTFYNLTLLGIEQIWHSYWVKLEVVSCYPTASQVSYIHFSVPWSKEDTFTTVRSKKRLSAETVVKLNVPKPNANDNRHPYINLILDPNCGYTLKMKLSLSEVLGQIFRHYYHHLLPWINAILLSALAFQIKPTELKSSTIAEEAQIEKSNGSNVSQRTFFMSIPIILKQKFFVVSMYGILPLSSLLLAYFVQQVDSDIFGHYLPYFIESHLSFFQQLLLKLFLYTTAYSIILLISTVVTLTILTLNEIILFVYDKLFEDYKKQKIHTSHKSRSQTSKKFPIIVSLILCALSVASCTAIGLLAAIFAHFIQLLFSSYKCLNLERRLGQTIESTQFNIHLSVLFLLLTSFIPTIPYGFIWLRNHFQNEFYSYLKVNDFQIPLLILLLSGFWQQPIIRQ
ncbi:GPI inositol-deacylase-like protein [Leptotrombidium deliense]|uniref:GPI inositol-deacylase n=1 Tax=Leptotrombidium deliense TaxID=299467 RepID=A0A443SIB5_9ACAR|nr:GPI inositol-deacylase-like protein [Leptotrombidium deliense]